MSRHVALSEDRHGIVVDGKAITGFPHLADLRYEDQLKVAAWAHRAKPEAISEEQRRLLADRDASPPTLRRTQIQRQDAVLASPVVRALWAELAEDQRTLVLHPEAKLGATYPLTSGELGRVSGLSTRQVQYWSVRGLLPCWISERGHRRFEAAGAIIAFSLARTRQHHRQHVADIAGSAEPIAAFRRSTTVAAFAALSAGVTDPDEILATEQSLRTMADAFHDLLSAPQPA